MNFDANEDKHKLFASNSLHLIPRLNLPMLEFTQTTTRNFENFFLILSAESMPNSNPHQPKTPVGGALNLVLAIKAMPSLNLQNQLMFTILQTVSNPTLLQLDLLTPN